ncbi:MAG: hypothetical protein IJZ59_01675 [Alphaproteobacteria bacterium]|nr:hypothetical protein [Alphaproteobacteria bacterium]
MFFASKSESLLIDSNEQYDITKEIIVLKDGKQLNKEENPLGPRVHTNNPNVGGTIIHDAIPNIL